MDIDPRITEIDSEISQLHKLIEQQQHTLQNTPLINKFIEWRKLKKLQYEHNKKKDFRKMLKNNIERANSKKNRKKSKRRAIYR